MSSLDPILRKDKAYSLNKIGRIFGHDAEWVRDTFVKPINRKTKKRIIDPETNEPITGVRHLKMGRDILIAGRDILNWLSRHRTSRF